MQIPEKLELVTAWYGWGSGGARNVMYVDNAGFGVRLQECSDERGRQVSQTWFLDALPGREFESVEDLRAAAEPLTDAEVAAATTDIYPQIRDVAKDRCGNRCRLCPKPSLQALVGGSAAAGRVMHDTWRVVLAFSWKDEHQLSLCDTHLAQYREDPRALDTALDHEAKQRMAQAEALRARAAGALLN